MKATSVIVLLICSPMLVFGQKSDSTISLAEVYDQINTHYPLMQKMDLQKRITTLNDQVARSGLFPEIQIQGSASYQSEVTEIPFSAPGTTPPQLSKDHYNVSVDISQPIYDGGFTKARRDLESGQSAVEDVGVKAAMWEVRRQAEQVYFGILNLQKRQESVELLIRDLEVQLASVQTKIENGILLPGNGKVLEAEILKAKQQNIQLHYDIRAAFEVLGEITGEEIKPDMVLEIPQIELQKLEGGKDDEISRPELQVFEQKVQVLDLQQNITATDRLPKISAFAKGAYGRPGYDVFNDDLHPFWLVGVRAQWSFKNWNNAGKKTEVLELQKKKIRADEEAFLKGVRSELSKAEHRIQQLEEQITLDEQVLELREEVVEEKRNQLDQGSITSTEYITELNAEAQARINLELRRLELIQSKVEYVTKKGHSWN